MTRVRLTRWNIWSSWDQRPINTRVSSTSLQTGHIRTPTLGQRQIIQRTLLIPPDGKDFRRSYQSTWSTLFYLLSPMKVVTRRFTMSMEKDTTRVWFTLKCRESKTPAENSWICKHAGFFILTVSATDMRLVE